MIKTEDYKNEDYQDEYDSLIKKFGKEILKNEVIIINPKGKINNLSSYVRLYELEEIKDMLKKMGMKHTKAFGDYNTKTNYDNFKASRMIILARSK